MPRCLRASRGMELSGFWDNSGWDNFDPGSRFAREGGYFLKSLLLNLKETLADAVFYCFAAGAITGVEFVGVAQDLVDRACARFFVRRLKAGCTRGPSAAFHMW